MDKFNILNIEGKREITLQKICDIIDEKVPLKFQPIKDEIHNGVITQEAHVLEKKSFYFHIDDLKGSEKTIREWLLTVKDIEPFVIFVDYNQYERENLQELENDFLLFPIKNIIEKSGKFFSYIRALNDIRTIAVTGTVGKTTTVKFLSSIVPKYFNSWINKGNANSYRAVARHIMQELSPEYDIYIQETGAGNRDSIKKSALMLNVDAFILLNVYSHHIDQYGTRRNILNDKTSFDKYMNDDGVCIINFDDELIRTFDFKHKVISFGINTDSDVDYRGYDIIQNGSNLEMNVEHSQGCVHISVNILGIHNAYNVLAAFALCKWLGISDDNIAESFKEYKSLGFRQNFRHIGGYRLLLDCYNCNEESLKADIETLKAISTKEGQRKIAVISPENRLGDRAEEISYNMGIGLQLNEIDKVIVVGNDDADPEEADEMCYGRPLYRGIKASGYDNVVCVTEIDELKKELKDTVKIGDVILFKGLYNLDFTVAVDDLFGTAISMNNPYYVKNAEYVKHKEWRGRKFEQYNWVDISGVKNPDQEEFRIPNKVNGISVHRISNQLFRNNCVLKEIDLGNALKHIGKKAFENCTGLKKLTIPGNVKIIEQNAFRGCTNLSKLIIQDGVTHIEDGAFMNCGLKKVSLPASVKYVADTAFDASCRIKYKK